MQHQTLGGGSELRHLHGREAELTELTELVVSHPLVTLAGPGGVGKSSLAEAVAAHAEPVFPDGVLMVRLAEVRAGAVLDAVSSAVELPRTGGGDRAEALARWLRPRRALLVVDNCEHLVEEVVEVLTHLLAEPRREGCLHVLTTSRRTLGLPLEQVLPVLPLALPGPQDPPEAVAATPSVSLFLERVRGRDRSFVVPTGQWSAVGELCRRLDGLPLALELAAGRASVLGMLLAHHAEAGLLRGLSVFTGRSCRWFRGLRRPPRCRSCRACACSSSHRRPSASGPANGLAASMPSTTSRRRSEQARGSRAALSGTGSKGSSATNPTCGSPSRRLFDAATRTGTSRCRVSSRRRTCRCTGGPAVSTGRALTGCAPRWTRWARWHRSSCGGPRCSVWRSSGRTTATTG